MWLFHMVLWVGLRYVIVVFNDNTHFSILIKARIAELNVMTIVLYQGFIDIYILVYINKDRVRVVINIEIKLK